MVGGHVRVNVLCGDRLVPLLQLQIARYRVRDPDVKLGALGEWTVAQNHIGHIHSAREGATTEASVDGYHPR